MRIERTKLLMLSPLKHVTVILTSMHISCLLKMEQNEDPLSAVNLIKASLKDQKNTKG